ncbi:MAG: LD-carboxypeptidase [Candidatus Nomurabacteria bacterium]|jgi:muramoyltetrapeptide carboxypeptidase LdcA involved in peptidoglycan recycling|nr:LD-carboxypeptidase [Candidatus Nomurabacteria bacterium]
MKGENLKTPKRLQIGDKVRVISPSSGILGEPFAKHELCIGTAQLRSFGLEVDFGENSLKGIEFTKQHPDKRANDIKEAFMDDSVKAIICAIGGDDTFRTVPFLLEDKEFVNAVKNNPKIFVGFSDATVNHFMFYQLGLQTFYGPSFLTDFAELSGELLPYTRKSFENFFCPCHNLEILSSPQWFEERKSFGAEQVGKDRVAHHEEHGYETIFGEGVVAGRLLGGCIESIYELVSGDRYPEQKLVNEKFQIMPKLNQWKDKIFFFETSEEKPTPKRLSKILRTLEDYGIFDAASGVIIGKPQDETYYEEYKELYAALAKKHQVPTLYNINFGHAFPRCVLPYGAELEIDFDRRRLTLATGTF